MKMILWCLAGATLFSFVMWVTLVRNWLRAKPWAWSRAFFAWIEPMEILLWNKSETILWARFLQFSGASMTVLAMLGQMDITPLMPLVPDEWETKVRITFNLLPLALTLMGAVDERLRRTTTAPLALVEVPELAAIPPVVAAALATAEVAKLDAITAVEDMKKAA